MKRIMQRAYHLWERIKKESICFIPRMKSYGWKIAIYTFIDGLIPPGKTEKYIFTIQSVTVLSDRY